MPCYCVVLLINSTGLLANYGELTTRWRYSHVRPPPLAEAATPPEVVAQFTGHAVHRAGWIAAELVLTPRRSSWVNTLRGRKTSVGPALRGGC